MDEPKLLKSKIDDHDSRDMTFYIIPRSVRDVNSSNLAKCFTHIEQKIDTGKKVFLTQKQNRPKELEYHTAMRSNLLNWSFLIPEIYWAIASLHPANTPEVMAYQETTEPTK